MAGTVAARRESRSLAPLVMTNQINMMTKEIGVTTNAIRESGFCHNEPISPRSARMGRSRLADDKFRKCRVPQVRAALFGDNLGSFLAGIRLVRSRQRSSPVSRFRFHSRHTAAASLT